MPYVDLAFLLTGKGTEEDRDLKESLKRWA
jgi:hypothetical protein